MKRYSSDSAAMKRYAAGLLAEEARTQADPVSAELQAFIDEGQEWLKARQAERAKEAK